MDAIVVTKRLVKGSSLTHAEGDANLDALKLASEQLDAEKLSADDAAEISETLPTLIDATKIVVYDTADGDTGKESTVGAIRAPLVARLDAIDLLLVDLEAAIEAIL